MAIHGLEMDGILWLWSASEKVSEDSNAFEGSNLWMPWAFKEKKVDGSRCHPYIHSMFLVLLGFRTYLQGSMRHGLFCWLCFLLLYQGRKARQLQIDT